jgi:hypothetical protein
MTMLPRHRNHSFLSEKPESLLGHQPPERERDLEISVGPVSRPKPLGSTKTVDLCRSEKRRQNFASDFVFRFHGQRLLGSL